MKIRLGFVSNSSSSSYVISIDIAKKCPTCGRSDLDILELIRQQQGYGSNDETEIRAIGKENILKLFKDDWYEEDEVIKELKNKLEKEDETKKKLALIDISYHDETMNNLLDQSNIKILWRSE